MRINAVWFCGDPRAAVEASGGDLVYLHGIGTNDLEHCLISHQETLITDLTEPADAIFSRFVHGYRRQIQSAEKENIKYRLYTPAELSKDPSLVRTFRQESEEVARLKGIECVFNEHAVRSYIQNGYLYLSRTSLNGTVLAEHITLADGKTARCMYSVSSFREEGIDPRTAGRANKLLHWSDIRYFKDGSRETYDWGGVSSVAEPTGVDAFKLGFGGTPRGYFNIVVGKSAVGRAAVYARSLKKVSFFT